ncbi:MAG: COX15/CtaA family protein [Rubrivivax sp.]|nr:COX15/CtaA family protein [Rubrivivax sp.]
MNGPALVDYAPALQLLLLAGVMALLPLSWVWLRQRGADTPARLAALTALTLFLTFDLVVFGAFTRLTDSGLGCPDWPGCYGQASPLAAREEIHAAQAALPGGPVSWSKAWIEMIHRYLAMTVGALIVVMTVAGWSERRRLPFSPWWPTLSLAWVIAQGLFGKYTVTLKLYPAVVTLHLLGGLILLAMLAAQHAALGRRALALPAAVRRWGLVALATLAVQVGLGGWVSTNYAVLACTGFPQCNGLWWPAMDFGHGFTLLHELGQTRQGAPLPFEALVAVHMAHRLFAVVATLVLAGLAWKLWRLGDAAARRLGGLLALLLLAQFGSGLANVVLGWPLVAAVAHSGGAAALVLLLTLLLVRSSPRLRCAAAAA